MVCQSCGGNNPDNVRFCGSCGASLPPSPAQPQAAPPGGTATAAPARRPRVLLWATCAVVVVACAMVVLGGVLFWAWRHRPGTLAGSGGARLVLACDTSALPPGRSWGAADLEVTTNIMRHRVDSLGVSQPVVYPRPPDRIVVELPGMSPNEEEVRLLTGTGRLEFRYVPELDTNGPWTTCPERAQTAHGGEETGYEAIIDKADGRLVSADKLHARVFAKAPAFTGADLKPNAQPDVQNGSVLIHFEFQDSAKAVFEDFTRSHVGKTLGIFWDNRLVSAPRIVDAIPGEGIIQGRFTPEAARTLANQLNAGALPVPLKVESMEVVRLRVR